MAEKGTKSLRSVDMLEWRHRKDKTHRGRVPEEGYKGTPFTKDTRPALVTAEIHLLLWTMLSILKKFTSSSPLQAEAGHLQLLWI